ncbi:MAG: SufE family protein [Gemmatimonadales bacterium]
MPTFDNLIQRLHGVDRDTRLELLLDYARKLPDLPARYHTARDQGVGRVHECQTPVFLWVEQHDGTLTLHADVPRESPTVRGFVGLLKRHLDGATPAEVAAFPNDLLDRLQLTEILGMTRMQGLTAVLGRVKRMSAELGE